MASQAGGPPAPPRPPVSSSPAASPSPSLSASTSPSPSASPSLPTSFTGQIQLPFTGLNAPRSVAVDTTGNVYVTDRDNNRVLELPAGSTTPDALPFSGL